VRATIQLVSEHVKSITYFCAGCFRFMSSHVALAVKMVEEKTLPAILDIISSTKSEFILGNLAICLVNLTHCSGQEGTLVEESIALCFTGIATRCPSLLNSSLCTMSTDDTRHVCLAALCNLSDIKACRGAMIEEGVVHMIIRSDLIYYL
jgi:hypothetical protein